MSSSDLKSEAQAWIREMAGQIDHGLTYQATQITLTEYLSDWLSSVRDNVKTATWKQYEYVVRLHITPFIGKIKLSELSPLAIQRLYSSRRAGGVGARTVQLIHAVLHAALEQAVRLRLLGSNPGKMVDRPKVNRQSVDCLTEQEIWALLARAKGTPLDMLLHLAITTGMRQGELLGLKWRDVQWDRAVILVNRQLKRVSGGLKLAPLKTEQSKRAVQIGKSTLEKLGSHLDEYSRSVSIEDEMIFAHKDGRPYRPEWVLREFKSLLAQAGIRDIRFHDLRHTAASLMLSSGMPVIQVSRQLGHSQPSTTLNVYGHFIPGLSQDAAEKVDELVNPIAAQLQLSETSDRIEPAYNH